MGRQTQQQGATLWASPKYNSHEGATQMDLQRKMQLGGVSAEFKHHSHQSFNGFLVALSSADLCVLSV